MDQRLKSLFCQKLVIHVTIDILRVSTGNCLTSTTEDKVHPTLKTVVNLQIKTVYEIDVDNYTST